jgi:hypothetical protein
MDFIVYLTSFVVFFFIYYGLNLLLNYFRKDGKSKKSNKDIFKNSLFASILYIIVLLIAKFI